MKTLITLLLLLISFSAEAFVLVGTAVNNGNATSGNLENTFDTNGSGGVVAGANLIDDLGTPKRLGEFYRWNTPYLAYGFDDSFVQFFGVAGMNAVNDAMRVLNDFFDPEDGSYSGVSDLNLGRHGFGLNYNTMWLNESAAQERLLDLKSVALGSMVNYLGLGNPYRYAFTATNAYLINPGGSGIIFESTLKNYDPITR
ncbi:MAG: hypothetical protein P8M70_08415, partial [Verrucomicrobiota bacterium]|nr:hypothetical protein [Verrucomicrobiota bacterium]